MSRWLRKDCGRASELAIVSGGPYAIRRQSHQPKSPTRRYRVTVTTRFTYDSRRLTLETRGLDSAAYDTTQPASWSQTEGRTAGLKQRRRIVEDVTYDRCVSVVTTEAIVPLKERF